MSDLPSKRVAAGWTAHTRQTQTRARSDSRPPYLYASGWHPCSRKLALDLTHPEDAGDFDDQTLERFARGSERERDIVARLSLAGSLGGWTVEGGQKRYEIRGRSGDVVIVGKVDGLIRFDDDRSNPIPFDVKSGASVQSVTSLEQMLAGRWTRSAPFQMLAYLYGEGVERGLLILDQTSGPRFVDVFLSEHLMRMESFLVAAEAAVAYRTDVDHDCENEPPPFIEDASECFTCDHFRKSCAPPIAFGEGLSMYHDPELIEAAETYLETKDAAKRNADAWKTVSQRVRGCELGSIGGRFDVVGKWVQRSTTVYPDACECGRSIVPTKTVDPCGSFRVTVTPTGTTGDE